MFEAQQYEEGKRYSNSAEKKLKRSIIKWKPLYEKAGNDFRKSGVCFKNAKCFEQAGQCFLEAAKCYKNNKSFFQAAKCIEEAIIISNNIGDYMKIEKLAKEACRLLLDNNSLESALKLLIRSGDMLYDANIISALRVYQYASEVALNCDEFKEAAEITSKITRLLVKIKYYREAINSCRREITLWQKLDDVKPLGRIAIILIFLHITLKDYVAAEKVFREWGNFCSSTQVQILESLLIAYDECNREKVVNILNSKFIKEMDIEYIILAKELPLPSGVVQTPRPAPIIHNAAPSYVSPRCPGIITNTKVEIY